MSDPLVQELREEAERADIRISVAKLLYRAAQAIDAAHQREAALRDALERTSNIFEAVGPYMDASTAVTVAIEMHHLAKRALAATAVCGLADRDPAVPGLTE